MAAIGEKQVKITLKDKNTIVWKPDEWDEHSIEGNCFVLKKDGIRVGIYNMDVVSHIVIP